MKNSVYKIYNKRPGSRVGHLCHEGVLPRSMDAPSFLIAIRDKASVTKGVWKVSNDFHRTSDVVISWIHLKTKNPLEYRAYWAFYDGTIEVTELTEHKIKGFFSGTVRTDPNSIIPSHESFKVTDGEFFVNRNPGYSIESRL